MDKQMIFSFQTHKPKVRENAKKIEYFQNELSQLQDMSRQCRSKSSTDMHSVTTADSRQYQGICEEVSAFVYPKKDLFSQSLNKITINQQNKEIQTETLPKPKLELLQECVLQLQMQKEEIFHQITKIKKENGILSQQNKQYECEVVSLKNQLNQITQDQSQKENYYQQLVQKQNWQVMQLTQEIQQMNQQQNTSNTELSLIIQMLTMQEQELIQKAIKQILKKTNKNDRLQIIEDWYNTEDLKEEIIQLKKSHNDKLKDLMERIKILQSEQVIEPELLSTQESLALITNVFYRAIKSNEMLTLIKQNQRLTNLIEELWNKLRFRLEYSNYSQQHIRTSSLNKTELSSNKKYSYRKV